MTISIDTNLIVRLVTNDEPRTAAKVRALISVGPVLITTSVFLEAEWVLRTVYGFPREKIAGVMERFIAMANVTLSDVRVIAEALAWFKGGMDFGDALHLASSIGATRLVTLDRDFIRAANRLATTTPVTHLENAP